MPSVSLYLFVYLIIVVKLRLLRAYLSHFLMILFVSTGSISYSVFAQASSGDCLGAIPVCQISYDVPVLNVPPDNVPNEISGVLSCLATGEDNGVWYTFTVQTNGVLHFNIIPYVSNDDYDWALFNLTNADCEDIRTNASLEVECNFSSSTTNFGITGANGGPNPQDEPTINVTAGQRFVLYISNFSQSPNGYKLDFSNSTAQVPDNVPPSLVSVQPNLNCNASSITVTFSENIACNSVQPNDFTFDGPGGPYTITTATGIDCQAGAAYSTEYVLTLSPSIGSGGTFTLSLSGVIEDICGNQAGAATPEVTFDYNAMSLTLNVVDADCGVDNGQATVNVLGGVGPFEYLWSDPNAQTTQTATGLARGNYVVTVTDAQGCTASASLTVSDPTSFTFQVVQQADTCSKGVGVVTILVNGTTPPYQYTFTDHLQNVTSGNPVFTGAVGDSILYIRVTDDLGCWLDTLITVNNIQNDTLLAYFTVDNPVVNVLYPYAHFFNASQYYSSFVWEIEGQNLYEDNFIYHFVNGEGSYPVTIYAYDENGCKDTYTMIIDVLAEFSLFIPNAFTINQDGLNEKFEVKGMGLQENTFEMYIYDRWGRCVYESRNIYEGWDGSIGATAPAKTQEGVYVYRIYVRDNFGTLYQFTGKLVLIK